MQEKDVAIGLCRREVERNLDSSALHSLRKTPFYKNRPQRKIQYSPKSKTISCIRLDREDTLATELSKKRDSYAPADDACRDISDVDIGKLEDIPAEGTNQVQERSDKEPEIEQAPDVPPDRPLSPFGSIRSLDLSGSFSDLTQDQFLITGPPSVQSIRVESPANSLMNDRSGNQDTSITMLERPVPPSYALPKNIAMEDPGNVAQRIMGKDISSCFEPIKAVHTNSVSDSDEDLDIDISNTGNHSDGESTIPYADDSDPEVTFDDQETQTEESSDGNIYDFDKEANMMSPPVGKSVKKSLAQARRMRKRTDDRCGFLGAKLHKTSMFGEVNFVEVGKSVHDFLKKHPLVQGIYLNKGKRAIKKNYVTMCRQKSLNESARLTWKRGSNDQGRNRVDDYFEYTEEGRARKSKVDRKLVRDEYVVSWYMWCPGHGNCVRKCGGRGKCVPGKNILLRSCVTYRLFPFPVTTCFNFLRKCRENRRCKIGWKCKIDSKFHAI